MEERRREDLPFHLELRDDERYYVVWDLGGCTFADTPTLMLWERLLTVEERLGKTDAFLERCVKMGENAGISATLQKVVDAAREVMASE